MKLCLNSCMKGTLYRNLFMIFISFVILVMFYVSWNFKSLQYSWRSQNFMFNDENKVKEAFENKENRDKKENLENEINSLSPTFVSLSNQSADVTSSFTPLLSSIFPSHQNNKVSDKNESQIWWHYPTFKVGSYNQITNNLKYMNNPDIARCTPDDLCFTIYENREQPKYNYIYPLPPAQFSSINETRVNYFTTPKY